MIVFHDPAEVPAGFGPSVVAIGKFDGVHTGHRAVIDRARVDAATGGARRMEASVPHPGNASAPQEKP